MVEAGAPGKCDRLRKRSDMDCTQEIIDELEGSAGPDGAEVDDH
jgi:hypothetical protein